MPVKDENQNLEEDPQIQPRDSAISSASYLTYKTAISENNPIQSDQINNQQEEDESSKKQELQDLKSKLVALKEKK